MFHFTRHLLEMIAVMAFGMIAGSAVFSAASGLPVSELLEKHSVAFVAVMAASMTLPMVVWMWLRGHSLRACFEMTGAMAVPAVLLIVLRVTGAIGGTICGAYCLLSVVAMVALMLYRRESYAAPQELLRT